MTKFVKLEVRVSKVYTDQNGGAKPTTEPRETHRLWLGKINSRTDELAYGWVCCE